MSRKLVLGIGDADRQDDGAGILALRQLRQEHGDSVDVRFVEAAGPSLDLYRLIESTEALIVIDTAELDEKPGTVREFQGLAADYALDATGRRGEDSASFADLLSMAWISGRLPKRRAVIGIQPDKVEEGGEPTEAVRDAIPDAVRRALALLRSWERQ